MTDSPASKTRMRKAVVIGSAGQDGRILSADLEADGYDVVRIERSGIRLSDGSIRPHDIRVADDALALFEHAAPDEIYYLAAHHHSSEQGTAELAPLLQESFAVHCFGLMHILDAIANSKNATRLFYASSSLIFGQPDSSPQNEATPPRPVCAYGVSKAAGMGICDLYRRERNLFCCSGILFNHESPHRGSQFVSKKIVSGAVDIHLGVRDQLELGSLDAQVDWGAAADYVRAMRLILQLESPQDFVIATGQPHSVMEFAQLAFAELGMDYSKHVRVQPKLVRRPLRKAALVGDTTNLRLATGWFPKMTFGDMIKDMVRAELASRHAI
jgi:GDPmannose 4,6-dehydratase